MLKTRTMFGLAGALMLLVLACGPAATATPLPRATAMPTTAPTTAPAAATATPTKPPPSGGATPQPTATSAPAAVVAKGPKHGGTLRYFLPWDPRTMDMLYEAGPDWAVTYVQEAFANKLYTREYPTDPKGDCTFKTIPVLAEGYKWTDDLTLEVTLKQGVKFHNKPPVNGREAVAQDWVDSWTYMLPRQYYLGFYALNIDSMEAKGKYTLVFHLKNPVAFLPEAMFPAHARTIVMPAEAKAGPKNDYSDPSKSLVGTGPYMFKDWQPGVKVSGVRNPDYFKKGLPYADGIELLLMPDISTRVSAFRSGKLDVLTEVPATLAMPFRKDRPDIRVTTCPNWSGFGMYAMRSDKAPFNDVRVRRALSMAIDRKAIVDTLFLGEGAVFGLMPLTKAPIALPLSEFPPEARKNLEYNPEEAKKLLAEAGLSKGLEFTIETTTGFGTIHVQGFEMAVDMWNKIGAKAKLVFVPHPEYLDRVSGKSNYDQVAWFRPSLSEPYRFPTANFSKSPPGENRSWVKDPELDKFVDEYQRAKGMDAQAKAAHNLQIRMADQVYLIMLPLPMEFGLEQPYVRDFGRQGYLGYVGTFFERIWFDK
ncbi:MAG: ABC transporter substrate-binding protein [Chloroflexi bacterium]|nr:ABC transporter substrate-binding protein [Chloroflexota bacterium]